METGQPHISVGRSRSAAVNVRTGIRHDAKGRRLRLCRRRGRGYCRRRRHRLPRARHVVAVAIIIRRRSRTTCSPSSRRTGISRRGRCLRCQSGRNGRPKRSIVLATHKVIRRHPHGGRHHGRTGHGRGKRSTSSCSVIGGSRRRHLNTRTARTSSRTEPRGHSTANTTSSAKAGTLCHRRTPQSLLGRRGWIPCRRTNNSDLARRMVSAPKGGPAIVTSQHVADQDAVLVGLAAFVAPHRLGEAVGRPHVAVGIGRADEVGVDPAQIGRDGEAAVRFGQRAVRGAREAEGRVRIARQDLFGG
mmetsp:Transcript_10981/g.30801  ORF Transcript_10981/g.30801 Transcript_10981/m.30801 type:complete len:303 (-) Transcript_10981:167-1075(-)